MDMRLNAVVKIPRAIGRVSITVNGKNAEGDLVEKFSSGPNCNVVTNHGMKYMLGAGAVSRTILFSASPTNTPYRYLRFGTGTVPRTSSDVTLGSDAGISIQVSGGGVYAPVSGWSVIEGKNYRWFEFTYQSSEVFGEFTEMGLFPTTANNLMQAGFLIKNSDGEPITLVIEEGDQVVVKWRLYLPAIPGEVGNAAGSWRLPVEGGTVTIDGVDHDYSLAAGIARVATFSGGAVTNYYAAGSVNTNSINFAYYTTSPTTGQETATATADGKLAENRGTVANYNLGLPALAEATYVVDAALNPGMGEKTIHRMLFGPGDSTSGSSEYALVDITFDPPVVKSALEQFRVQLSYTVTWEDD